MQKNTDTVGIMKKQKHSKAPRGHTRASTIATEHKLRQFAADNMATTEEGRHDAEERMFKLKKFKEVKSRVGAYHTN